MNSFKIEGSARGTSLFKMIQVHLVLIVKSDQYHQANFRKSKK